MNNFKIIIRKSNPCYRSLSKFGMNYLYKSLGRDEEWNFDKETKEIKITSLKQFT